MSSASPRALSKQEREKTVTKAVKTGVHAVLEIMEKWRGDADMTLACLRIILSAPVDEVCVVFLLFPALNGQIRIDLDVNTLQILLPMQYIVAQFDNPA